MANQLKVNEQTAIKQLSALGWGIRRISRELNVSRNTVRNYVRSLEPLDSGALAEAKVSPSCVSPTALQTDPLSTPGKTGRQSLCLVHAEWILKQVETGLSAQRIYQDLRLGYGFAGSYQSVKRYVQRVRQIHPEVVQRIEVEPGEEVQVDFGTGPTLVDAQGKRTKTWVFRIVLSYSRKAYSEAVLRQDTETFLRCIEKAFLHYGGVALTINLDNLKAAVLKADWADPELNPKLIDFARHYGTTILPCLPRTPEHKGKVESSVKYVKDNGLLARKFSTLAQVNEFLLDWEKTVADQRIHGTTKRQVAELFLLEKPFLVSLPGTLFPCFQEGPRSVHRDGHIEVAKAYYHVPAEYLQREVWARYDNREVRIFVQDKTGGLKQIQVHRRLQPGKFTNPRGIGGGLGSLQVNLEYWLNRACQLGTSCEQWARAMVANRGLAGMRSLIGLVALTDRHSFAALNRACERASAKGTWRLRDVKALLAVKEIQTQITFEEHHPLIRNLSEYGLFIQQQTDQP
jgi:transposase